jgi:diadenosine tetraphosphatase ApaH/serine/threonine PP2A family protein phosphatase
VLTDYSRSYLESLRPEARVDGAELFHASPRDPVWDYVLSEPVARESLEMTEAPVIMVGHSHVPLAMLLENGRANGGLAPGGHEADLARGRWLLNPGSVGQPRDNDPRAAFLILDFEENRATFMRAEYPVERTQSEIRAQGLPETLAQRLALGL